MADRPPLLPAGVARFLESLLGRKVAARPAPALALKEPNPLVIAEYFSAAGSLEALLLCDLPLACALGAAFAMVPAGTAADAAKAGKLEGALAENFQETVNILASLLNQEGTTHVNLRKLYFPGGPVPPEVKTALAALTLHVDVELQPTGYAAGRLSLFYR